MLTRAWGRDKVEDLGIDGKEIEVKAAGSRCDHLRRVHGDKKKKEPGKTLPIHMKTSDGQAEEKNLEMEH